MPIDSTFVFVKTKAIDDLWRQYLMCLRLCLLNLEGFEDGIPSVLDFIL